MSTDDFEAELRTRLADLAGSERDWADPLPEARRRAAEGVEELDPIGPLGPVEPDDAGAIEPGPPLGRPSRRRWLPGLAVAATVAALLVGGGFGLRELVRGGTNSATSDVGFAAGGDQAQRTGGREAPSAAGEPAPAGGNSPVGGNDTAGCATAGPATSTGPLAGIASIRPSGVAAARASSGGTARISYQLTFGGAHGTAQVRAAQAVWSNDGVLCGKTGSLSPGAIQVVPVAPGPGVSGTASFLAVDSQGSPLPGGEYQVVVVIAYSVDGSPESQLVSAPVTVAVS